MIHTTTALIKQQSISDYNSAGSPIHNENIESENYHGMSGTKPKTSAFGPIGSVKNKALKARLTNNRRHLEEPPSGRVAGQKVGALNTLTPNLDKLGSGVMKNNNIDTIEN